MSPVPSDQNIAHTSAVTLLSIVFLRDDGAAEWWGVYALELEEAERWAQHELKLRKRRKGRWTAEIIDGWVDQATETAHGTGATLRVVRPDD